MDMWSILSLIVGGTGIMGIIISFITLPLTKKKNRAEIEKLLAEVDDKRIETLSKLQDELYETIEKNKKLFISQEREREAKEKLRAELNRLHDKEDMMWADLQNTRTEAIYLKGDILNMNTALLKKQIEADLAFSQIRDLERTVLRLRNDIVKIQKVTDKLVLPKDD